MTTEAVPNYHSQLISLRRKMTAETIVKSLFALAVLAAGVAAIIFLHGHFLAIGIGIILISSLAMYQYFNCYRHSRNIFTEAARAVTQNLSH